ncbi:hypothetical protein Bbelb_080930 [Branchiostoma belcheri]|nr:hypothetical protein Bbelb_080930 [Branchiostoma belcheri]
MADLKLVTVVIMAAALVATGHRRQEMESSWGAEAPDGDVVPDEESEGSIMDLFNFFEEMTKMFDAMSPGEEQEGHKTETTSGGEATEEETGTVDIAAPQEADKYQDQEEHPGALQRVKRLRRSRFRKEQEMESTWGAEASDGDVVPDEESEGSIMDLFTFFEEMSKMFDAMSPGEEKEEHTADTTSGGEATEEETGTVDIAVPHQEADEELPGALHRMKRQRQSRFRKRGVKQWFCGKLVDSSEERPRGKRGVREKLWQMFCIPGPASASSASSSSEEW